MTQIPDSDCSIIVPAYNEEKRIARFLENMDGFTGSFIFVCDGADNTAEVIERFASENRQYNIRCFSYSHRLGKGGGILEGFRHAETPYCGFLDADGSASIKEMRKLFSALEDSDCAIGSRWMQESDIVVEQGLGRKIQSRMFNLAVKILFGLSFKDTQCGAKAFRREAILSVMPQIESRGFEFDVEVLWRLRNSGFRIKEVPIAWEDRESSHVGGFDGAGMLANLIRLKRGKVPRKPE
ncbi:glycosyl transferase family 2 [Methanolacinia petrolearia DSM 11571]|uniref:dolichyl-phosphate beta-glucosyltransferase n=1 Tax=Methanolacinia petrolearia (strain DSM 11571 / OCM 486 / SEBR 4847) TaxID=679926 RepID=E1RDV2_METP4|nr:dolichyl-phosphate beta-glucosyltransferase [Methanolacinia petrolearia]ADN37139.1 glycosyl transferase family 2 [Methanolacinia petrolearia DSM 11571]